MWWELGNTATLWPFNESMCLSTLLFEINYSLDAPSGGRMRRLLAHLLFVSELLVCAATPAELSEDMLKREDLI